MRVDPYRTIEFTSGPASPEFIEGLKKWAWQADLHYAITTGMITNYEGYLITQGKIRSWEELEEYRKETVNASRKD